MNPDLHAPLGKPPPEAIYTNLSTVKADLESHARDHGYAITIKSSKAHRVLYQCSKGGKYDNKCKDPDVHESKRRRNTGTTKTDCKFMVEARKEAEGWKTTVLNNDHNHSPVTALSALPQYRIAAITPEERSQVKSMHTLGYSPTQILNTLRHDNPKNLLILKDIYNLLASLRVEELQGFTPIQWLLQELESRGFHPKTKINPETNQLQNLFFAHPEAIALYKQHPDVLLLDCTYKTNRFHMPLLNICSVIGNKKTVQVALCFMSGEKESDYTWAMNCLRELISAENITEPLSIVTDRELALMNSLDEIFPDSNHLLCTWHVNMNILANCQKHFPADKCQGTAIEINPKWEEFLKDWASLLDSPTELEYTSRLTKFRIHSQVAVGYVEDTWLRWKEKLIKLWVDTHLHFGICVTSPIEGCHAGLKMHLKVSTGDLQSVFKSLIPFWPMQHSSIKATTAQEQNKIKHHLNKPYFHRVQSLVYDQALHLIIREVAKLHRAKSEHTSLSIDNCTCTMQSSMGLPCFHIVAQRFQEDGYIKPEDIHPFWWYSRPEISSYSTFDIPERLVLDPAIVKGKGRPKGAKGKKEKGVGITSTKRDPSLFEYTPSSSAPPILPAQDLPTAYTIMPPPPSTIYETMPTPTLTTTQLGLQRLQDTNLDTYKPGTLPPRLYQTNPFAVQKESTENYYTLSAKEQPATKHEVEDILKEQEDAKGLSQAIHTLMVTSRAGRTIKPTEKAMAIR